MQDVHTTDGSDMPLSPPPDPKRRRLTTSNIDSGSTLDSSWRTGPMGYSPFWFRDGDIILEIETIRLRVHSNRLMCSSIFEDMLCLPQPAEAENLDGCPVVRLFDASKDWIVVFRWIYEHDRFMGQPVIFDSIAGALRISTKYDIPDLREWSINELNIRWPKDLLDMTTNSLIHAAEAIALSRECDVPEILPAAFYALSIQRWHASSEGGRSHLVLSPDDLRRLISGRELLQDFLLKIVANPLSLDSLTPQLCLPCKPQLERYWRERLGAQLFGSGGSGWGCWLLRELDRMRAGGGGVVGVCQFCVQVHDGLVSARMMRLQDSIPRMFLL
ncbi:hypothetical protein JAAARDRAFT_141710 [Jaapia argillacea MUCL 33604]|uniref:BTB domain-containing protein n=1 Tax=Jaapia argillacea MUCL 33604 TaxID=933084 RepID=A0A067P6P8_9AGAM|nr:hypothetical protein JAAARDRAFT_141710 [Jaapia argillacea MUCL 33604]